MLTLERTAEPSSSRYRFLSLRSIKTILYLAADLNAVLLAYFCAEEVVRSFLAISGGLPSGYVWFFLGCFSAVFYGCNGYGRFELRRPERELELSFKAVTFAFLALLVANFLVYKGVIFSRYFLVTWYFFALFLTLAARFGLRGLYTLLWRSGIARERVLLIGSPEKLFEYEELLSVQRYRAYDIVGLVYSAETNTHSRFEVNGLGAAVFGSIERWEEIAFRQKATLVVINLPSSEYAHELVLDVIQKCRQLRVDVGLFSDVLGKCQSSYEFDHFTGCLRLLPVSDWSWKIQKSCKAVLDLAFGIVGSGLTLLLAPIIGILIWLEDPGPIFHRREFVNVDGTVAYYLKFRTMVRDADRVLQNDSELKKEFAANHKLKNDPRVLRVGQFLRKYSIDEFPQFFSLLTGQLTVVGPRVISQAETERYGHLLVKRLSVKPGITGFWQVMGRQTTTYDERVQMDMFYIDHWSIWLDFVIIAKTVLKLIRPEGAY